MNLCNWQIATFIFIVGATAAHAKPNQSASSRVFTLAAFDGNCGQPGKNCRPAFQQAFSTMAAQGGGILLLPAGTFRLEFPEILSDTRTAPPLNNSSLLVVPPNTTVRGHVAADGSPDTIIEWSVASIPVFVFSNSSYSRMENLHFRFTGTTPHAFPYGDIALLKAIGFRPTFPHTNQMAGGNYEMFSVIYLVGSEHCTFNNLLFDSVTRDNDHVMGLAITAKGKNVSVEAGGGGITALADGNTFTNIRFYDYVMGLMLSGQQDLHVRDIVADRRGSTMDIAPGHVIYLAPAFKYTAGSSTTYYSNKTIDISNISEGPNTYSNIHSGGTFAIKYVDGGTISHVVSHHPVGLMQTLDADQHMTFQDMVWESDYPLCENVTPDVCLSSVINATVQPGVSTAPPLDDLHFENISLKSTRGPISVMLMGSHIVVDGLTIATPPGFKKGQTSTAAVLGVKRATDVTITNYRYIPLIATFDPREHYNVPFAGWLTSNRVTASVNICWPSSIVLPNAKHRILTPDWQDQEKDPDSHLSVTTKITSCPAAAVASGISAKH